MLSGLGLNFTAGIIYVLSLAAGTLTARGSDKSITSVSASRQGVIGGYTYAAFAPCKVLMGLVRHAQVGTALQYLFVPEDDRVVIGARATC